VIIDCHAHIARALTGFWQPLSHGKVQDRALVAKHPRAWVDLAAVPMAYCDEQEYPYPQSQEIARWAVETFGAEKVMWGTDYPPAPNYGTYRQLLDFVRVHCTFLNAEQKAAVIGGNAERFLKSVS
jgi:L-fuconolactonase